MRITLIRHDKESGKEMLTVCDAGVLMEKMKSETKAGYVTGLRTVLPELEGTHAMYEHIDKLPRIYPALEYARTKDGGRKMKQYNGLVQLEVKKLAGLGEADLVKRQAMLLPQTFAAFCGSSGKSVKIWVRFALPDGNLPKREQEAMLFHAHAYRLAVSCYQPLLPFPITLREPSLTQSCRMTLDEQPEYNPAAVSFCLEQPFSMPGEETFRQRRLAEKNPLLRMEPGYETSQTFVMLFESALDKAFRELENWRRGDDLQPLLVHLAEHCYKAGIPEEEVVRQVLIHYYRQSDEQTVRTILHNLYQECKGFGKKSALTPEQDTALRLEEFMGRRYEFRYNTVLNDLEFRQRDSIHFYFKTMDRRARNSIAINALKEGIRAWDRDVERYLTSDFVPLYNPVEEYLCGVGRWDGKDRIRALADLVPCNNPYWRDLFYRWFLSMVAHWRGLDRQHGNSTSPLLVGAQGFRKSTYCRIILPPELRFGYTDSLDFKSKQDAERYLGRFMLVNLDEFDQINLNQQGFLKHLLQKPVANLRKPYASSIQEVRRYASFIGTSNQMDLLTDPSGSRRFICIEVTAPIDTNVAINYRQLYAQAMHDIYKGERYWLDDKDEAILKQTNRDFEQVTPLEQLFSSYFQPAESEEAGEWLTAMEIFNYLQTKTRDRLSISKIACFGRSLRKLDIPCKKSNRGTVYLLEKVG
ncbi:BT4734/BF3469 family protein [Bacteroides stercorirosoris]|uniref:Virulence-associated protein E n=1 Tax=Bacteroides stercorirosoris TaxID=871324 RepID=A0A1M6GVP1_9BACE|nr:BT4734/BF3469 family protein [Bacteroides stercorirosoris]SHJ14018.1 Virulence-associated protein E [Bacteroides stercorirosoris]